MTEWRTLDWLPGYQISEYGDVRHVLKDGAELGPWLRPLHQGVYFVVRVRAAGEQKAKLRLIHRLVCEAWHGPRPYARAQVAHGDGTRLNNHYSNLRWASPRENAADRLRHDTHCRGERSPRAVLTWEKVREIRATYTPGNLAKFAERYGVHLFTISQIVRGKTWRETDVPPLNELSS